MSKAAAAEKPTPLGDRVYTKHRKMLKDIAKKTGKKGAEAVRFAIEDTHDRRVKNSGE